MASAVVPCPPEAQLRAIPLYLRVLAGIAAGTLVGVVVHDGPWLFGWTSHEIAPLGVLVVRLLKALATPLVFVAIVDSFLETAIGFRSFARLIAVCVMNVTVAMAIGLTLLDVLEPGALWAGHVEALGLGTKAPAATTATLDPIANLSGFVPQSIVAPFAENLVLSAVLLAILTGASLREVRDHVTGELAETFATLARFVKLAQKTLTAMLLNVAELMPFAVALIVADVVGAAGIGVFKTLWVFLATSLAGLLLHSLGWYPLLAWLSGVSPVRFFRAALDPVITALSCNSSLATMPVTLKALSDLGVGDRAARLSACVGTNFNNDGIMLYETLATLFLCQAMGMELTLGKQLTVVAASVMAGVGIAGIPEAGLVILPLVLEAAGLPEASIAAAIPLILPVDWIVARVRSGVNVLADMVVAVVLDRFEHDDPVVPAVERAA